MMRPPAGEERWVRIAVVARCATWEFAGRAGSANSSCSCAPGGLAEEPQR
jgi:hypothetical protein